MCGIAGFIREDAGRPDSSALVRMCDQLVHRGPDGHGYYDAGTVALGHRRLSIIDVAGGHQPIWNETGDVAIVFNGEIYNFLELRSDLKSRGHRFTTESDTETIVHLYEEAGERTPEYLNGMFAFAIWDARRKELFLARDRMGKKPLYYSICVPGLSICFASQLQALAEAPGFRARVDTASIADFLALSYVPDPNTIYQGVCKLPPAHSLTLSGSGIRLRQYWTPDFSLRPRSFEDAAEEIRALAADSVRRRMISDVPLGAFLSGGVDSGAVVGFMAAEAHDRVKTFSIGFAEEEFDELRYARLTVERNRTEHYEQIVSPSIPGALSTLTRYFDEPFGDSSAIPMLCLSRMTRERVTVALSGDGADEVFGGYRRYYFGVLEDRWRQAIPKPLRRSVFGAAAALYPKFDYLPRPLRAKTLLGNLAQTLSDAYFTSMSVFRDGRLTAVLAPHLQTSLAEYSTRDKFRDLFSRVSHLPALQQMQWVDFHTWLPGDILVKADRATMAYSLESRSPWLDYRLVELACRLPASYCLHGQTGKHIFKHSVSTVVPGEQIRRKKMGFSIPLAAWLRSSLKGIFESVVLAPHMAEYLSLKEVRRLWTEHQSGYHNHDRKLWNLLTLACWLENHTGRDTAAAVLSTASDRGHAYARF